MLGEGEMKRVLIVDDAADIRLMLRCMIERENYTIVAEAADGVEAVERYREHQPDITIMDIDMPFKSGVEAAREIRALAGDARIIFCSGRLARSGGGTSPHSIEGATFIAKPFLPDQLYQAMKM